MADKQKTDDTAVAGAGGFLANLRRRGVLRVALAYLAVAWLLLQVIETLISLDVFPAQFGRVVFFVLLLGFPIALLASWYFELTPDGLKSADDVPVARHSAPFGMRRIDFVIIGALSLVIVLLVFDRAVLNIDGDRDLGQIPKVSTYTTLSNTRITLPPPPSPYPLVSDASRIYLNHWDRGEIGLLELPQSGGDPARKASPFDNTAFEPRPYAITPDGTQMIIGAETLAPPYQGSIYLWPVTGGAPRRLVDGKEAAVSRDGTRLFFKTANEMKIATVDFARAGLSDVRTIGDFRGNLHWPVFAPDGDSIRYTLAGPKGGWIYEIRANGRGDRQLKLVAESTSECCGSWTPDGHYYVFQATVEFRTQIWAVHNVRNALPVPITEGALDFRRPTILPDGSKILAVGWQLHGELMHYDRESDQFVPLGGLESLSAEWLSFSIGDDWVAYVSYPEAALWRSRADGTDRLQLTFPPMRVRGPAWSPDGNSIAFTGEESGSPEGIYVIAMDGSNLRRVSPGNRPARSPTWSPGGGLLAYDVAGKNSIQILNINEGSVSEVGAPYELDYQKWSPDGRYFSAFSEGKLFLYDVETEVRTVLVDREVSPDHYWSRDGKSVYFSDAFWAGQGRSVYRIDIDDGAEQKIAQVGDVRSTWGVHGIWIGIAPDGAPLILRDLSIQNVYALEWSPEPPNLQ